MKISVIVPTHNPDPGRLGRTLRGLAAQTLPATDWETILVNNASTRWPDPGFFSNEAPPNLTTIDEPLLGLTSARRAGFTAARGDVAVLVDDDNVLATDYLAQVLQLFAAHPRLGALGGKSVPEFAKEPPAWAREFFPLLALRDLGHRLLLSHGLRPAGAARNVYPEFAPIGAGLAIRREAWTAWLTARSRTAVITDRRGGELTSGGDNDLILCALRAGWEVAYSPALSLTHLIPPSRLEPVYLAQLNRGIQKSWMQVLALHDANPWPPLTPFGAQIRKIKAWFRHQPWRSTAAHIRWQGACGHFDGRARLPAPDTGRDLPRRIPS